MRDTTFYGSETGVMATLRLVTRELLFSNNKDPGSGQKFPLT